MASSTVRRGTSRSVPANQTRLKRLPLTTRRCGAWVVEVSLIFASAFVPYQIGLSAKALYTGEPVPLNPMLATTEEAIAKTLAIPLSDSNREVAPLTNLFWSGALITPLLLAGFNLYLLGKTGQTLPKRWFGVKVVTAAGTPPGIARALVREGVGRWGLPLGVAYTIWRYSGAFPDLGILTGLTGLLLLGELISPRFHRQRRSLHDRLAGTYVVDAAHTFQPWVGRFQSPQSWKWSPSGWIEEPYKWGAASADSAVPTESFIDHAIVLTSETNWRQRSLWTWMRQHPGLTLLIVSLGSIGLVIGTLVGTQVYIQSQANWREFRQQDDTVYLKLVKEATSPNTATERRGAILALGTIDDPRAIQLLRDLLGQEGNPLLIDAIQQALVSTGPEALPYLQKLNQSLQNDLDSLSHGKNKSEKTVAALRQQATQRAIAKILTVYSGQIHSVDLNRTNLGQTASGPAQFTLVLNQADLSGMQFKGAVLTHANLQGSRFYGPGEDDRWETFDDWIADLKGTDLKEADLTGALLSHVSLVRASLIRATLNKANLSGAHLTGANLSSAKLIEADLRQAILDNASLTGADLGNANLSQTNLHAARLGQVSAVGTQLQFANLTQSDWKGADLSEADLSRANLQNANLSATRMAGTNFSYAQLQNANFQDANLGLANFRGVNLDGADFKGATFVATPPAQANPFIQVTPTSAQTKRFKGVNFTNARNLDANQIAYICLQGGRHPQCR